MQPLLEEFVPTRGSREALAAVRGLLLDRAGGPPLVLLHGPPGLGKTHLLRAVARLRLEQSMRG